jgi:23S rRNA (uracil1939-C5)-methyltransferase
VRGLRVVDGYGGIGAFATRVLAAGAGHATIVESSPSACTDARENVRENGFAGRADVREEPFGSVPLPACDVLVVDPPRAGLGDQGTAAVLAARAPRVLVVACSLESLARDLASLHGTYRTTAVRLCDLFPHTDHVETLALLELR